MISAVKTHMQDIGGLVNKHTVCVLIELVSEENGRKQDNEAENLFGTVVHEKYNSEPVKVIENAEEKRKSHDESSVEYFQMREDSEKAVSPRASVTFDIFLSFLVQITHTISHHILQHILHRPQ